MLSGITQICSLVTFLILKVLMPFYFLSIIVLNLYKTSLSPTSWKFKLLSIFVILQQIFKVSGSIFAPSLKWLLTSIWWALTIWSFVILGSDPLYDSPTVTGFTNSYLTPLFLNLTIKFYFLIIYLLPLYYFKIPFLAQIYQV